MIKFCTSLYPFLGAAVIVALFCGLALGQQIQIRRKQITGFNQHSTWLLLAMLVIAFISMAVFVAYVFGPRTGC